MTSTGKIPKSIEAKLPAKYNSARLPANYEAAKLAIAEASKVDECKDWADKALALASYARQAKDQALEIMATRIRVRAIRRVGALLLEVEKAQGGDRKSGKIKKEGVRLFDSRKSAASKAGISEFQAKQSIRVANVPEATFEMQVESENPPTVTELARQGTQKRKVRPIYEEQGMSKEAFQAGMYFRGDLRRMAEATQKYDPQMIVDGSTPDERKRIREWVGIIDSFNDRLISKL